MINLIYSYPVGQEFTLSVSDFKIELDQNLAIVDYPYRLDQVKIKVNNQEVQELTINETQYMAVQSVTVNFWEAVSRIDSTTRTSSNHIGWCDTSTQRWREIVCAQRQFHDFDRHLQTLGVDTSSLQRRNCAVRYVAYKSWRRWDVRLVDLAKRSTQHLRSFDKTHRGI